MAYDATHIARIVTRIFDQCEHPQAALRVWSVLQLHASPGQVVEFDRDQLAQFSGVSIGTVSRVISELGDMSPNAALERVPQSPRRGRGPIKVRMKRFW